MRRNALLLVAGALALGLIAAGCGGDDNDNDNGTTSTAAAISKEEFVAKGNQICKQGNGEVEQAGKQLGQNVNEAQLEDFAANTLVPNIQGQIDDVRALGAPAGEEQQVTAFLDGAQADLDQLKADPAKIKDDSLFNDVDQHAKALGLTECAG
jgi:hypothetical protein